MREIEREGLPEAFSRPTQARHHQKVAMAQTSFGPLLQGIRLPTTCGGGGETIDVWFQHPFGWL
eukprot:7083697-Pyramimonas_sp.AAC.1